MEKDKESPTDQASPKAKQTIPKDKAGSKSSDTAGTAAPPAKKEATDSQQNSKQSNLKEKNSTTAEKTKASSPKQSSTAAKTKPQGGAKSVKFLALVASVALVIGGLGVFAGFYNYNQYTAMVLKGQNLAENQNQLSSSISALTSQLTDINNANDKINSQLLQAEQKIQKNRDQQEVLKVSIEHVSELTQQKGQIPLYWKYAEIEYLLTIANHRLLLEHDINTALVALHDADVRLKNIGDPALIPIRGKIADEISALNSVELPDLPGMSARLSSLVNNIEQLPLITKEHILDLKQQDQENREVDTLAELPGVIWDDIKNLVDIRRSDDSIEPLLPPDQKHYLAQNLGLKLEESRIALLNRDTPVFRQNLSDTRLWVERYFDPQSAAVTNVVSTVNELETVELKPQLPDISGSLRQLRDWMSQYKNQSNAALQSTPRPKVTQATPKVVTTTLKTDVNPTPPPAETNVVPVSTPKMISNTASMIQPTDKANPADSAELATISTTTNASSDQLAGNTETQTGSELNSESTPPAEVLP